MEASQRLQRLRALLLAKALLCFLVWGLPAWLAPAEVISWFGLEMPEDPVFLRSFGAMALAMGVAYWLAYQDPVKNAAIVQVGIIDNGLATLTVAILGLTHGISSWFVWLSGGLTALFTIAFARFVYKE